MGSKLHCSWATLTFWNPQRSEWQQLVWIIEVGWYNRKVMWLKLVKDKSPHLFIENKGTFSTRWDHKEIRIQESHLSQTRAQETARDELISSKWLKPEEIRNSKNGSLVVAHLNKLLSLDLVQVTRRSNGGIKDENSSWVRKGLDNSKC